MAPGKLEPLAFCFGKMIATSPVRDSRAAKPWPYLFCTFDQAVFPFGACYCESVEMAVDAKSGHRGITPRCVAEPVRPPALFVGFIAECDLPSASLHRASNLQNSWLRPLIGTKGLESRATHCKQKAAAISNRDKKALLHSGRIREQARFLIANPRLEILASCSKGRVETKSNRKFIAIFQMGNRLVRPAQEHCSGGVSGAYGDQKDQIAFAEALLLERRPSGPRGIVAAVVLPKWSILTRIFESSTPRRSCIARMMRRLAWCGTTSARSRLVRPLRSSISTGQLAHSPHSILENLRAFLVDVVHALFDRLVRRGMQRTAGGHVEIAAARTVDIVRRNR